MISFNFNRGGGSNNFNAAPSPLSPAVDCVKTSGRAATVSHNSGPRALILCQSRLTSAATPGFERCLAATRRAIWGLLCSLYSQAWLNVPAGDLVKLNPKLLRRIA